MANSNTCVWLKVIFHYNIQELEISMVIPDSTHLMYHEIWDEHGKFQQLHFVLPTMMEPHHGSPTLQCNSSSAC